MESLKELRTPYGLPALPLLSLESTIFLTLLIAHQGRQLNQKRKMQLNLNALPHEFLDKYLSLLSSLRPPAKQLSPLEKKVLIAFALLPSRFTSFPFSPAGKKAALSSLPKTLGKSALHAKIYALLRKGYLIRDEDKVILIPPFIRKALHEFTTKGSYTFALTISTVKTSDDAHTSGSKDS